jgi:hypothetical protein
LIDDEFQPDRIQLRALGHLLLNAQKFPVTPFLRERELYERVYERPIEQGRQNWLNELADYRLVRLVPAAGVRSDEMPIDVCLTPAGSYYSVARAHVFGMNARTPTDDFPNEIVDSPWTIHAYYSPDEAGLAPTADRFVRFDDNAEVYDQAIQAIDRVADALASDNEIGAAVPAARDEMLEELKAIRNILENREGWITKLIALGGATLIYLSTQFADRPVGYLADQAWLAIQALIGLR